MGPYCRRVRSILCFIFPCLPNWPTKMHRLVVTKDISMHLVRSLGLIDVRVFQIEGHIKRVFRIEGHIMSP